MQMKIITTKLLMTASLVVLLLSCKKDNFSGAETESNKSQKNWDNTVKAVAKDVSIKLKSIHFRKMLKHEVTMRFDGDANILLSSIIKRLPKYLAFEASKNATSRTSSPDQLLAQYEWDILAEAAEQFPQMQIAVQTDAEAWDPNAFVPSVVYLTEEFNEGATVNGYDPNQNVIVVGTEIDPIDNYVVISQNERTTIRASELRLTVSNCLVEEIIDIAPYNPDENATLIVAGDCGDTGGGGTGGGGTGGGGTGGGTGGSSYTQYVGTGQDGVLPTLIGQQTATEVPIPTNGSFNKLASVGTFNGTTVYRTNYRHEKMRQIRVDKINQIEAWPAGAPEIRLHVFEHHVSNPSEVLQIFKEEFEPDRRRDINDQWWDADDVTMYLWDYQGTGTKTSFGYYEYDPVLIPNETLEEIGGIIIDFLAIASVIPVTNSNAMTIYGNVRQSYKTVIRSLKMKNGMGEYIGKDDYSIFNDEEQFNHSTGGTKFNTTPDL
ncbi:MAG: hypothetical protein JWQ96_3271 [Segetibacter sp.]|nr:hypothetical protein [Segetibacter sp.]